MSFLADFGRIIMIRVMPAHLSKCCRCRSGVSQEDGYVQHHNLCGGGDTSNIEKHEDFSTFNDDDAQRSRCCRYQGAV